MFSKILIANRGEIAVRIIRACKEMGIATVAVYAEADREALHVSLADESICIGPAQARDSYLNMTAVLSAAMVTGAEAIHPGYGLLSENPKFAALCQECHLVFIGPSASLISLMGDKDRARSAMREAGVPVIPGSDVVASLEDGLAAADAIGYPLLIKARSGGGGRGIRRVDSREEFAAAYRTASAEAQSAFGDGAVYLEKFLYPARHVEVQLLADRAGHVICLGERACSIQRNNQKLLEESPAPALSEDTRRRMLATAVQAARAVRYENAGTLEFLVTAEGDFYFMEMNTRLQVEHTVTEMVTGIDLVKWQIRIAAGIPLSVTQAEAGVEGCAIECRINAENGAPGRITTLHIPGGPWVRFDTAIYQDYQIPPFYDSMIGKLIVHAKTREEAIRKMRAALCELVIEGVAVNSDLQLRILEDQRFIAGDYATDFMEQLQIDL